MDSKIITVWTLVSVLAFGAQDAFAAKSSKEENIGIGTGGVIGAVAGGPVGFIIGAAIGAKIGDTMHQKSERIDSLEASLDNSQAESERLAGDVSSLNRQIAELQNVARPELVALMQAGIDLDLLFRTDEFALADGTGERLQNLAATLAGMPDVHIQLDGFADERGATDYNQALSEKRVDHVRDLFIAAGVHPTRIGASAHGESVAPEATADSFALERRVSVKLFIDNASSVAAN